VSADGNDLAGWSPKKRVVFTDEELIERLRRAADAPAEPAANWYTFYSALPKPERDRLAAEAAKPAG
jgi:hypothetical protein